MLSSESFDSKYFELFSSTNKKKSREPMVVMFSDKDEAEEFLKFMADKYSKKIQFGTLNVFCF